MTLRQLPPDEWYRLDGLPISAAGLPDPATTLILVAENDKAEVVGVWSAVAPIVLEGLWVREDYRHTTVAGRLLRAMRNLLNTMGVARAYTLTQTPYVLQLAKKAGFEVIPGDFCMLTLKEHV